MDEILNLIESVSERFSSYSFILKYVWQVSDNVILARQAYCALVVYKKSRISYKVVTKSPFLNMENPALKALCFISLGYSLSTAIWSNWHLACIALHSSSLSETLRNLASFLISSRPF